MSNNRLVSNGDEDTDSVIHVFLDTLGIKKIAKQIFNFIHIKTTDQFIDGFILLVYLLLLFGSLALINLDHLSVVITLVMIGLFIIIELIGKNTDVLKRILFSEESNKWFIENINSFSYDQIRYKINNRVFSYANISLLLEKIIHDSNLNSNVIVEEIIEKNDLSKENLDKIFQPDTLRCFREGFIHYLLIRFKNTLSVGNVKTIYDSYKSNDMMVKMIFATQLQSELLIKNGNEDPRLTRYFELFRQHRSVEFEKIDKKISINFVKIRLTIIGIIFSITLWFFSSKMNPFTSEVIIGTIIIDLLITMIVFYPLLIILINPWLFSYRDKKRKQFIEIVREIN